MPEIFDLRIELVKWVIERGIDLRKNVQELLIELGRAKGEVKTQSESILIENALFSLRTAIKITNSILFQYPLSKQKLEKIDISYEQIKVAIEIQPLPDTIKSSILKFIDVSLSLDFALIVAVSVIFKKCKLSKARISELSRLLRDWGQEYGALAIDLQLWKPEIERVIPEKIHYSTSGEIMEEERQLADAGIYDYLKQIIDEEGVDDF